MKKIVTALALVALSATAVAGQNDRRGGHDRRDISDAALIIGTIGVLALAANQPREQVIVQQAPVPVYPQGYPQPMYQQPMYPQGYPQPRQLAPVPRVMSSFDPCQQYGQMVQTYDQFGYPMGFRLCR